MPDRIQFESTLNEIRTSDAVAVLEANRDHIVKHLSALNEIDAEEFPQFLELVFKLAPSLLAQLCNAVGPRSAAEKWSNILRGHRAEVRRSARWVIQIISQRGCGETKELANKLLVSPHSKWQVISET